MNAVATALLAVDDAFATAGVPYAVGGAIALAYCVEEPRATRDIDINVFVDPSRAGEVLSALPAEIPHTGADTERVSRDGQVRLWWKEDVPVDLFFDVHEFYAEAAAGVRQVPFMGHTIPVIGCSALVVFKCLYGRTRDWADIEAILEAGALDCEEVLARLRGLVGPDHPSVVHLRSLCEGGVMPAGSGSGPTETSVVRLGRTITSEDVGPLEDE